MDQSILFEKYRAQLKAQAKNLSDEIAHRNCATYSDYSYQCGVLRGLDSSLGLLEELIIKLAKDGA